MDKEKIRNALAEWVLQVADKKESATPEEIAALPKVAKLLLRRTMTLSPPEVTLGDGGYTIQMEKSE